MFVWLYPELFKSYAFYVTILLMKYFITVIHIAVARVNNKVPKNPEDGRIFNMLVNVDTNENVERIRRAQLNDLENIPFFITVCFFYLNTEPSIDSTIWIMRAYVLSRILYTIFYVVFKSAWRIVFFYIGYFINIYLCCMVIYNFAGYFSYNE